MGFNALTTVVLLAQAATTQSATAPTPSPPADGILSWEFWKSPLQNTAQGLVMLILGWVGATLLPKVWKRSSKTSGKLRNRFRRIVLTVVDEGSTCVLSISVSFIIRRHRALDASAFAAWLLLYLLFAAQIFKQMMWIRLAKSIAMKEIYTGESTGGYTLAAAPVNQEMIQRDAVKAVAFPAFYFRHWIPIILILLYAWISIFIVFA